MQNVEWGEFRLGDLFEKIKTKSLKYKTAELPNEATNDFILPALTAGVQNQGLNNFVPLKDSTILKNVISISANGANTGATFYQSKSFTVLQDAYAIQWIDKEKILTDNQYLFLASSISQTIFGHYEWTNKAGWEKVKLEKIQLPIKDNKIDFEFMENFIAELEAERIAELEAYFLATGLDNYTLTEAEKQAISSFKLLNFNNFNLIDVFNVKNTRSILSRDIVKNSGNTPYLCASAENNAVNTYISYDESYLDQGNCVFIGGKTFVVTYQKLDFFSNDSHNLALYLKNENYKTKLNQLYLSTCVEKSLDHKYSWGDSVSNKKIQKDIIALPVKDNQPDYEIMEIFISAIQKLVIKDVVHYADQKIEASKVATRKS